MRFLVIYTSDKDDKFCVVRTDDYDETLKFLVNNKETDEILSYSVYEAGTLLSTGELF